MVNSKPRSRKIIFSISTVPAIWVGVGLSAFCLLKHRLTLNLFCSLFNRPILYFPGKHDRPIVPSQMGKKAFITRPFFWYPLHLNFYFEFRSNFNLTGWKWSHSCLHYVDVCYKIRHLSWVLRNASMPYVVDSSHELHLVLDLPGSWNVKHSSFRQRKVVWKCYGMFYEALCFLFGDWRKAKA